MPTTHSDCLHCESPVHARGLCKVHYDRWWRTGRVEGVGQGARTDLGYAATKVRLLRINTNDGFWEQVDALTRERLSV